jgi:hypothetical protein
MQWGPVQVTPVLTPIPATSLTGLHEATPGPLHLGIPPFSSVKQESYQARGLQSVVTEQRACTSPSSSSPESGTSLSYFQNCRHQGYVLGQEASDQV